MGGKNMLEDYNNVLNIKYENNATSNMMALEMVEKLELLSYQIEMIKRNKNIGILYPDVRYINNKHYCYYDITSKLSLEYYFKNNSVGKSEIINILLDIVSKITSSNKLLLDSNCFLIKEDIIYINPISKEIYLAYLPFKTQLNVDKVIKKLVTKLIIQLVVFDEKSNDNYIQKILNCVKSDIFKTIDLENLLHNLNKESISQLNIQNNSSDKNEFSNPFSKWKDSKEYNTICSHKKAYRKSIKIIAILCQILLLSTAVLLYIKIQPQNISDMISTVTGIILIFISLDFLILRKLFDKKNLEDVILPIEKSSISDVKENNLLDLDSMYNNISKQEIETETILISNKSKDSTAYLESVENNTTEIILITKERFVLGRLSGKVDYRINDNAIGRVHAELVKKEDKHYIKDLNSKNGTWVSEVRIPDNLEYEIKAGDIIELGNKIYRFNDGKSE